METTFQALCNTETFSFSELNVFMFALQIFIMKRLHGTKSESDQPLGHFHFKVKLACSEGLFYAGEIFSSLNCSP